MTGGRVLAWSDDARVMVRPFSTYRALARESTRGAALGRRAWVLMRRPLLFVLVIGGFVSFTTAGRWIHLHVLSSGIAWSFAPAYEILWILVVARLAARGRPASEVVDLYFTGQAPWLMYFLFLAGVCLFAPAVWPAFRWMLASNILLGTLVVTIVWSGVLTFAFFREGLGLSARGSLLATFGYYLVLDGTVVGWYVGTGQLLPLLSGTRG